MLEVKKNELLGYRRFVARSVWECLDFVHQIHQAYDFDSSIVRNPVMWFRGHSFSNYVLQPTLYRSMYSFVCEDEYQTGRKCKSGSACAARELAYGIPQLLEEMRYQNYRARNIGLSERGGEFSKIDWLGHMQHHGMKTRLLDWTESLIHALMFAVEPLLDPKADSEKIDRLSPHIWILFPQMLNARVLNTLHGTGKSSNPLASEWLERYDGLSSEESGRILERIYNCLEGQDCLFRTNGRVSEDYMNLLFNLRVIGKRVENLESRGILLQALQEGSYILPLFPLIHEYYTEGRSVEFTADLPPLAFTQERQSKRIISQKGNFTIFPFYKYDPSSLAGNKNLPMEEMSCCQGVLFKIELCNCEEIAWQLREIGITRDWLYPEDPVISEALEGL